MLVVANTINVAADIAAMGEALRLIIGGRAQYYALMFGGVCLVLQVFLSYRQYVSYLKWLTLSLFSYVGVVFASEYVSGSPHISRQLIDFVEPLIDHTADKIGIPKITKDEVVGFGFTKTRKLKIGAPHPKAFALESLHQMMANETARPTHQGRFAH